MATVEYRQVPDERRATYRRFLRYAFSPEDGPPPDDAETDDAEVGDRRGLFDGDDLLVVCNHYWFETRLRGDWHPMAGLSAVASPPEHRHRGLVARLIEESLAEYRERDHYLAALWPFKYAFYRKYGWARVGSYATREFDPGVLSFTQAAATGEFRPADADDWPALDRVYEAQLDDGSLAIRRTEAWWRHRIFERFGDEPYVYLWKRDGDPAGYLVYTVDEDGDRLTAWDVGYVDHEAYLNVLRFLHNHEAQVETVRLFGPPDSLLDDLVEDPRAVDVEINPGAMFRLVDVSAALEALDYGDVDATLRLRVTDETAGWNDRAFRLDVDGGEATVEREAGDQDAAVDVATLSQLYAGYPTVETAERAGTLRVETPDARETLAALFPPRTISLRDGF